MMIGSIAPQQIRTFLQEAREACPEPIPASAPLPIEEISERWLAMGMRPGDLVLLCFPNSINLLRHWFGALGAGAVPALLAPNTPWGALREMAAVMGARAIAGKRFAADAADGERHERIAGAPALIFPPAARPAASPGEVVLLTSGTSGFASGCVFDFGALLLNADRHARAIGQRAGDTVLVNLPLHFSFALVAQALATLVRGGRLVVGGPPFHTPTYLRTLRDQGVTISALTPVLARNLLQSGELPGEGLRVLSIGGDSLAPDQVELLLRRRRQELYLTYGLTQAGPRVSTLAAHAEPRYRYGSVGRPLDGTAVALHGMNDGSGLKQLVVSSATVMKRRIGVVEGAASDSLLAPGTVATGDIFDQDAEGYLTFRGRVSDFIVRDGEKICLAAVRRVATQMPYVFGARTIVETPGDGKEDFILELRTAVPAEPTEEEYAAMLRRWLRRAEMPRAIRLVADRAHAFSHK